MKRVSSIFLLLLVLVVSVAVVSAQGQGTTSAPGVWGSSINLQNKGTEAAHISIAFYTADGTLAKTYSPEPLAGGGALSIYVPGVVTSLGAGQYSSVVSSDQPVVASVNTSSVNSTTAPWTAFAYDGFDATQSGTTLFFPGNYKNYYNFFSEIVVQNTSANPATITGKFLKSDGTVIANNVSMGTIAPNASKSYPMSAFAQLPSGTQGLFGAVISSSQPAVGVVNIWRTTPTNGTASYSAFTAGSQNLYPPALYKNYYGFGSALTVQNVSTSENAVGTITYSNGATANFNLNPGAAQEFYQPANPSLPSGNQTGVFAAKVVATSGSVVGLVSLSVPSGASGSFASYNVPAAATSSVSIPNINSDYYGFFSAVTVQNTGATPTNVTITYANATNRVFNNVPAGGVVNILHLNGAGDILPNNTSTSAVVTSSNGNPLVAVVQHNTEPSVNGFNPSKVPSDFLLAVTGINE